MIPFEPHQQLRVSVIITCFNQGNFLTESISSVLKQSYSNIELIVIDDGSTDNTKEVSFRFPQVKYFYQQNAGLSSARNTGIEKANGSFLVFLDADDWLYPEAIRTNLNFIQTNPSCAFVSGWHDKVDEWNYPLITEGQSVIEDNNYLHLLQGNYIGMHACVMYQRSVFNEFRYDTTLRACEDYDLYLKIARHHKVGTHSQKLAAYRIHGNNMSAKIPFMLKNVLAVCNRQKSLLRNKDERKAFQQGLRVWKEYYTDKLYSTLQSDIEKNEAWPTHEELTTLAANKPLGLVKYLKNKFKASIKSYLKKGLPDTMLKKLYQVGIYKQYTPKPGNVQAGDFDRKTPFSYDFGFDRGGAIDRFYIENFLQQNSSLVQGRVLEIGDNEYTLRYGADKVLQSEILHVDSRNEKATYIGDITDVPQIPSGLFDCIIFTQTLHLIYDFKSALATCHRILKPGGCLLLTVPGISHIDHGEWKDYWLWSFTDASIKRLMRENFKEQDVEISTFGNVYVAAAFLYGMGLPEFRKDYLFHNDPSYQVIISAKAMKA